MGETAKSAKLRREAARLFLTGAVRVLLRCRGCTDGEP